MFYAIASIKILRINITKAKAVKTLYEGTWMFLKGNPEIRSEIILLSVCMHFSIHLLVGGFIVCIHVVTTDNPVPTNTYVQQFFRY